MRFFALTATTADLPDVPDIHESLTAIQKFVKSASPVVLSAPLSVIYWLTVTAVFLVYTFGPSGNGQPSSSWVIWAVGGVLFVVVMSVTDLILRRKK